MAFNEEGGEPANTPGVRLRRYWFRSAAAFLAAAVLLVLAGCDPLTVHKVTTTIFDGVPSMPPAEQYCKDYHERALKEEADAALKARLAQRKTAASSHPPYAQKRCSNCHDKNTESGFVTPADELCAHCHKNFPQGEYLHGPAAVGACLKCHVPHTSDNPSLIVKPKSEICGICHVESRLADSMHKKVISNGMYCTDCHDPHGGSNRYFLK
ncbi:cytochrome c3 family protein [Geomesophilobacter sediminis]|uniref:cytochrome c3 family protein n=1 Tax=Geomesophilobacter sediminis TaxID=2798584 RepID=UPI002E2E0557|nr:cytochrome c3 family protein [Geomesophilobacter sediminis]